jgi:predicted Zn-dependent peptidase
MQDAPVIEVNDQVNDEENEDEFEADTAEWVTQSSKKKLKGMFQCNDAPDGMVGMYYNHPGKTTYFL